MTKKFSNRSRHKEMIKFTVYGKPEGKARPRHTKSGHVYTPEKTKNYEQAIAWAYRCAGGKLNTGYITVDVKAFYKIPKSATKEKRGMIERGFLKPALKPDIDNVIKAVLDGLNGVAYGDDSQVIKISGEKIYAEEPCIVVEVQNYETGPKN